MPWADGGRPVPSEPRLVTVVEGNPAVSGRELNASSARNGAAAWCARSSSRPSPSMISRQARPVSGRPSTFAEASPVSEARMEEERSARLDSPYEGRIGLVRGSRAIRSAPGAGDGVVEGARERQHRRDGVLAVGGLADPKRQVIGGDRAEVAVVGLAALVAAVGRLELHVAEHVP